MPSINLPSSGGCCYKENVLRQYEIGWAVNNLNMFTIIPLQRSLFRGQMDVNTRQRRCNMFLMKLACLLFPIHVQSCYYKRSNISSFHKPLPQKPKSGRKKEGKKSQLPLRLTHTLDTNHGMILYTKQKLFINDSRRTSFVHHLFHR